MASTSRINARRARSAVGEGASRRVVLVAMCAGYFLVLLDVTIVNVALPRIGSDLGSSVSGLQWVVDGYAIALAALMLAGGTVGDLRGHKRVVLAGLAVFGAGSLGCALAAAIFVGAAARQREVEAALSRGQYVGLRPGWIVALTLVGGVLALGTLATIVAQG